MNKIKHIGVFSFAKLQAILLAVIGIIAGILYSFGGLVIDGMVSLGWLKSSETMGLGHGTLLAFAALIGMPLLFAGAGFVLGYIEAIIYNGLAKKFGGLDLDLQL